MSSQKPTKNPPKSAGESCEAGDFVGWVEGILLGATVGSLDVGIDEAILLGATVGPLDVGTKVVLRANEGVVSKAISSTEI